MKTKLILLIILGLFLSSSSSCEPDKACPECRNNKFPINKENLIKKHANLGLNINTQDNVKYQPFLFELYYGFVLAGKIESIDLNNRKIHKIDFKLIEQGDCFNFEITNVKWVKIEKGEEEITHELIVTLGKKTDNSISTYPFSTDDGIELIGLTKTKVNFEFKGFNNQISLQEAKRFPPIDCPFIIEL